MPTNVSIRKREVAADRQPCVHILASGRHGTLSVGVTSGPIRRLHGHRTGAVPGFTRTCAVKRLVRIEPYEHMPTAIEETNPRDGPAPQIGLPPLAWRVWMLTFVGMTDTGGGTHP